MRGLAAAAGGATERGRGIKVAIIDTGIDVKHPCFADSGYPAHNALGNPTSARTTRSSVRRASSTTRRGSRASRPADLERHGTHVAGTVACNFRTGPATVNGAARHPVRPVRASPRRRSSATSTSSPPTSRDARSEDILNALDAALELGFDVANMSLGGGSHGFSDLLAHAVDNVGPRRSWSSRWRPATPGPGDFTDRVAGLGRRVPSPPARARVGALRRFACHRATAPRRSCRGRLRDGSRDRHGGPRPSPLSVVLVRRRRSARPARRSAPGQPHRQHRPRLPRYVHVLR